MDYIIRKYNSETDKEKVRNIFNFFIKNSFAAYPDTEFDESEFEPIMGTSPDLPKLVILYENRIVGFAFVNRYHRAETFNKAAVCGYFILPDFTGKGVGKIILEALEEECSTLGIKSLLVHISSRNTGSIRFHRKHGFTECGRFQNIGTKFGEDFDIIWMQKFI